MAWILTFVGATLVIFSALILQNNNSKKKNKKMFRFKKVVDIAVYISFYIIVVTTGHISMNVLNKNVSILGIILWLAVSFYSLFLIYQQLAIFINIKFIDKDLKYILASLIIGIITSFSIIYLSLYMYNPSWFYIDGSFGMLRLAFEFIYYTFSISITYSSNTIMAIGVIPKIVEMIHIILFYLMMGDIILSIFKKIKENNDNNQLTRGDD